MVTTERTKIYPDMLVLKDSELSPLGMWCVDYTGTQDAESIKELFGGCVLMTPYSGVQSKLEVYAKLK